MQQPQNCVGVRNWLSCKTQKTVSVFRDFFDLLTYSCMNPTTHNANTMVNLHSRTLVVDYIFYRLNSRGLEWPTCPRLSPPTKVNFTMRALGDEFETRYRDVFQGMCDQLHITPSTAYPTFTAVTNELFTEGITWGRVVAMYAFGGALAVQCVDREMAQYVDRVVDWITQYTDNNLSQWISENGGWNGLVHFYEGTRDNPSNSWPSGKALFGVAALGLVTLGATLLTKT
ncbi:bcl-2-like protein 2 [Saccoglossus kowalevskii]|uniref:Apoptosis regulator R1-like n=1 Tax=Saccoglossus kowalevskii TaxID=10224 RepID=A0ABM0GZF0_SACKO|nr:PREDICTED: apoptosis regulator R1-like [Saccoglossus kowalevskii]